MFIQMIAGDIEIKEVDHLVLGDRKILTEGKFYEG